MNERRLVVVLAIIWGIALGTYLYARAYVPVEIGDASLIIALMITALAIILASLIIVAWALGTYWEVLYEHEEREDRRHYREGEKNIDTGGETDKVRKVPEGLVHDLLHRGRQRA